VPIAWAAVDKGLRRSHIDPDFNNKNQLVLPRMGYELVSFTYDGARKINKVHDVFIHNQKSDDPALKLEETKYTWTPVPYNLEFELSIMVEHYEDGLQIIEQILPYFQPDFNVQIIEMTSIKRDINIVLTSVSLADSYAGSMEDSRIITFDMTFTLKTHLYAGLSNSIAINRVVLDMFNLEDINNPEDSEKEGVNLTTEIDPLTATETDEWEAITTKTDTINSQQQPKSMTREIKEVT